MMQAPEATGILRSDIDCFMDAARDRGLARLVGESTLFASGLQLGFNLQGVPQQSRLLVATPLRHPRQLNPYSIALLAGGSPTAPFFMSAEAAPLVTLDTTLVTPDSDDPPLLASDVSIGFFTRALHGAEIIDLEQADAEHFFRRLAEHALPH